MISKWTIGGLAYLIALGVVVRVSADLLVPALPCLAILMVLVLVFRRM